MVEAIWSGCWPTLCFGSWTLKVNGVDYTHLIPEELRDGPMNTFGTYQSWHFDDDWSEVFEDYEDGLYFEAWYERNPWVDAVPALPVEVYTAFAEHDWRHGSCGGCI